MVASAGILKNMIEVERIAEFCHEVNRLYCQVLGDNSQLPWKVAPWWQKQSAIAGVMLVQRNPDQPPSFNHEGWKKRKLDDGWKYGEIKDEEAKTHPCILPYGELPPEQKVKDQLFKASVLALSGGVL